MLAPFEVKTALLGSFVPHEKSQSVMTGSVVTKFAVLIFLLSEGRPQRRAGTLRMMQHILSIVQVTLQSCRERKPVCTHQTLEYSPAPTVGQLLDPHVPVLARPGLQKLVKPMQLSAPWP